MVTQLEDLSVSIFFDFCDTLLNHGECLFQKCFGDIILPERPAQKFFQKIIYSNNERKIQYYSNILRSISKVDLSEFGMHSYAFQFLSVFELSSISVKLDKAKIDDFLSIFNAETQKKLKVLNLKKVIFSDNLVSSRIVHFRNLKFLNVSRSTLKSIHLEHICQNLHCLVGINISKTKVENVNSLKLLKDQLELLDMHNLSVEAYENIFVLLKDFSKLRYLDMSRKSDVSVNTGFNSCILSSSFLKSICLFDISGHRSQVRTDVVFKMLKKMTSLSHFIFNLEENSFDTSFNINWESCITENSHIVFIGPFTLDTIINSLKYSLKKYRYLLNTLHLLFEKTRHSVYVNHNLNYTLLEHLRRMSCKKGDRLIAITAVIYNVTIASATERWPKYLISEIVRLLLILLDESSTENQQFIINTFLILCNDCVIHNANFDKLKLGKLVFLKMSSFKVEQIQQAGMVILSTIGSELVRSQLEELVSDSTNFKIILKIICEHCLKPSDIPDNSSFLQEIKSHLSDNAEPIYDFILKYSLSALWNLTDECAKACATFVESDGLIIYSLMIKNFKNSTAAAHIFNKSLGLLNNIAEDPICRIYILTNDYLEFLREMLNHEDIQMTYFAGGILSNLLLIDEEIWLSRTAQSKKIYETDVCRAVENWVTPDFMMASYRSYNPFEYLIVNSGDSIAMILWSLWAIRHTLIRERNKYKIILEGHPNLIECIKSLTMKTDSLYNRVKGLANDIIKLYTTELTGPEV